MHKTLLECQCGKKATWYYMGSESDWYCCNTCVPRGCTCFQVSVQEEDPIGEEGKDWMWVKGKEGIWEELDGEGKQLPCIEWLHDEGGFEDD